MEHKKRLIFLILVFSVSALLLIVGCSRIAKNKQRIDHIFLITIDTLRADHLGCYGYPRETSPFIDSLAKEGILFEKAYSQSASTVPSHVSIFTGLYPFQHRVLANGYVLVNSYTTLAELLKNKGFKTAAFVSIARCLRGSKINQGFDVFDDPIGTINLMKVNYRPARLTRSSAALWLDNFNPKQKLFLWMHLYDPHVPYLPPSSPIREIKQR